MDHEGTIFVYAALDSAGRIAIVDSSIFVKETAGWVQIDRSDSGSRESRDAYAHAQGNYFPGGLTNSDDTHRYIYDPALTPAYREATAEELEQERAEIEAAREPPGPTAEEKQLDVIQEIIEMRAQLAQIQVNGGF